MKATKIALILVATILATSFAQPAAAASILAQGIARQQQVGCIAEGPFQVTIDGAFGSIVGATRCVFVPDLFGDCREVVGGTACGDPRVVEFDGEDEVDGHYMSIASSRGTLLYVLRDGNTFVSVRGDLVCAQCSPP